MEIIVVALVAVGFYLVWKANQTNKFDINNDGKVDTNDVKAAVAKVEEVVVKAEEAVVEEVKVVAKKTATRAKAGAKDADPLVALGRQPRDGAPGIEDRLPAHLQGPRDVGADDVVGAVELWRHALVDRKSTRLNSSHVSESRMPSSA